MSMHRKSVDITTAHRHTHDFNIARQSLAARNARKNSTEIPDALLPASFLHTIKDSTNSTASRSVSSTATSSVASATDVPRPSDGLIDDKTKISSIPKELRIESIDEKEEEEKRVKFKNDDIESFTETISRSEITDDEKRSYWYSRFDLYRIKDNLTKFGKKHGLYFNDYSQDLKWDDSVRGAELMSPHLGSEYMLRIRVSSSVVMTTQKECHDKMHDYETSSKQIARNYARKVKVTQDEAYKRAEMDRKVAKEMYNIMDGKNPDGTKKTSGLFSKIHGSNNSKKSDDKGRHSKQDTKTKEPDEEQAPVGGEQTTTKQAATNQCCVLM